MLLFCASKMVQNDVHPKPWALPSNIGVSCRKKPYVIGKTMVSSTFSGFTMVFPWFFLQKLPSTNSMIYPHGPGFWRPQQSRTKGACWSQVLSALPFYRYVRYVCKYIYIYINILYLHIIHSVSGGVPYIYIKYIVYYIYNILFLDKTHWSLGDTQGPGP